VDALQMSTCYTGLHVLLLEDWEYNIVNDNNTASSMILSEREPV